MRNALPKTLPGVVRPQMVRCGKPGCTCERGALHGPYFYRFWREGGRLRKQYIARSDVPLVQEACERRQAERRLLTLDLQLLSEMAATLRSAEETINAAIKSRTTTTF
jgi:hypothetical protein